VRRPLDGLRNIKNRHEDHHRLSSLTPIRGQHKSMGVPHYRFLNPWVIPMRDRSVILGSRLATWLVICKLGTDSANRSSALVGLPVS
jgi:hypothetical protein